MTAEGSGLLPDDSAQFRGAIAIIVAHGGFPRAALLLEGVLQGARTVTKALQMPRQRAADDLVAGRRARDDLIRAFAETFCGEIPELKRAKAVAGRMGRYKTSKWSVDKTDAHVSASLGGDERAALYGIFAAINRKVPTSEKQIGRILDIEKLRDECPTDGARIPGQIRGAQRDPSTVPSRPAERKIDAGIPRKSCRQGGSGRG